jgi:hydroxyacylglutathione hydrolase
MYFRQLRLPDLGCASYIVGSDGVCAVVDPRWDAVAQYVGLARQHALRIAYVIETHTHADHVSGASRLAARTGATVYVHRAAPVTYAHHDLDDGDELTIGGVRIIVLHTPGHSMDSISLLLHTDENTRHDAGDDTDDGAAADRLLSGDTLFVGDVGRPDLHGVEAASLADALYTSLHERLRGLDDGTAVFPGHLAGSLCGKRIASDPSTTLGRERRTNPSLAPVDRETFVRAMLADLPPRPPNVTRIVELNRSGAPTARPAATHVTPEQAASLLTSVTPVDGRDYIQFAAGHLGGALNAPIGYGQFGLMLAWLLLPDKPLLLVAQDEEDVADALDALMVVGMTNPVYILDGDVDTWRAAGLPVAQLPLMTPDVLTQQLASGAVGTVLDVREPGELAGGMIRNAINLPYRQVGRPANLPHLEEPVAVVCNSGNRSTLAASVLARYGVPVVNLSGGTRAWEEAGFPLVVANAPGS